MCMRSPDRGVSEMYIWYADEQKPACLHSSVSCEFRHMQSIWLFQSFFPPRSPLPTFPESQVNIKYSLLPWWQPKCWCAETHVYNLHFLCPAIPYSLYSINLELESLSEVCAMILHGHSILYATTYLPHKHLLTLSEDSLPSCLQAWDPLLCHYSTLLEDHHRDTFKYLIYHVIVHAK